jgi:hypothetical protein
MKKIYIKGEKRPQRAWGLSKNVAKRQPPSDILPEWIHMANKGITCSRLRPNCGCRDVFG